MARSNLRRLRSHRESHRGDRADWLRVAVLGADDAIVSTASLTIGVSAAAGSRGAIVVAGFAGVVAGAMSMAVGEYVSVSSQRDTELADVELEKRELASEPLAELRELAGLYEERGLTQDLALQVATQLSAKDRLGAHVRDELGIDDSSKARPVQAAIISAVSFASFALLPVLALLAAPASARIAVIAAASLASLAATGALGSYLGGAPIARGALRVALGGALAMTVTAAIGRVLGVAVG